MDCFICAKCKFKFKTTKNNGTCPYCGKNAVEKEKGVDELIDEVNGLLAE